MDIAHVSHMQQGYVQQPLVYRIATFNLHNFDYSRQCYSLCSKQ